MKKLLIILMFVPLVSFGQTNPAANLGNNRPDKYTIKDNSGNKIGTLEGESKPFQGWDYNAASRAQVEGQKANATAPTGGSAPSIIAASAAMSDASTTIKVPLSISLKDYTHMAIVDVTGPTGKRGKAYFKAAYRGLLSSQLTIINPTSDKKKFKANSLYLRDTKNSKWLYLYLTGSRNGVDKSITTIIRDYENNIVYSAKTLNIGFYEVMANIANL